MNYTAFDDETLLRLIGRSQSEALSELYDRYGRLVYSVAFNATADPGLAEEITQDAFLRVWQHARSFNPRQGKVTTWLTSIARHRAIDLFRRQRSRHEGYAASLEAMLDFELPDESQNVEASVESGQREIQVRWALGQLPLEQRQVLALAYFRGLTQDRIAQVLSEPLGTVKTRMRLGLQKLRHLLKGNDSQKNFLAE